LHTDVQVPRSTGSAGAALLANRASFAGKLAPARDMELERVAADNSWGILQALP